MLDHNVRTTRCPARIEKFQFAAYFSADSPKVRARCGYDKTFIDDARFFQVEPTLLEELWAASVSRSPLPPVPSATVAPQPVVFDHDSMSLSKP